MTHSQRDSTDRRVQRTRKLLVDALIELTIRKGFAAVTVQDITAHAGVNRATFYRHYQDKFDLLDQYGEEVYRLLDTPGAADARASVRGGAGGATERLPAGLVRMFEHIRAHATFYRVMLGKNGVPGFSERIQHYIERRLSQSLPDALQTEPLAELFLSYVASGSVGAVLWWLEHGGAYAPADMATLAVRLSVADLGAVLGREGLAQARG